MKTVMLLALASAIACVIAGVIIVSRPMQPDIAAPAPKATRGAEQARAADATQPAAPREAVPASTAGDATTAPPKSVPRSAPSPEPSKAAVTAPGGVASVAQGGGPAKEPLQDPLAREALVFVGADPIAEEYWFAAINDPNLPAQERQDLIEDLNEDGLSDPKHPAPGELPLILNRLVLIERIAPTAPDQVNADALQEAYKDLQQLARMAMGSGEVVR